MTEPEHAENILAAIRKAEADGYEVNATQDRIWVGDHGLKAPRLSDAIWEHLL